MIDRWACAAFAAATVFTVGEAWAGYQTCGDRVVSDSLRRCDDGSIPFYHSGSPPGGPPAPARAGVAAGKDALFGRWRTNVPGAVWQSPSSGGRDQLHVSPGAVAGDLVIYPDGRYVWNAYGGKSGRWRDGDADYPIVLIDEGERKAWKVGLDDRHPGQIYVWDGYVYYAGKR